MLCWSHMVSTQQAFRGRGYRSCASVRAGRLLFLSPQCLCRSWNAQVTITWEQVTVILSEYSKGMPASVQSRYTGAVTYGGKEIWQFSLNNTVADGDVAQWSWYQRCVAAKKKRTRNYTPKISPRLPVSKPLLIATCSTERDAGATLYSKWILIIWIIARAWFCECCEFHPLVVSL